MTACRVSRIAVVIPLLYCTSLCGADSPPLLDRLEAAQTAEERDRILDAAGPAADAALLKLLRKRAAGALTRYDYAHSLQSNLAALAVAERLHDLVMIAVTYHSLGQAYYDQGKVAESLDLFRKGLDFAEAAGDKKRICLLLRRIAGSQVSLGNLTAALEADERGLKLAHEIGDAYTIALLSVGLGADYVGMGEYRKAAATYNESLHYAESAHDNALVQITLKSLGVMYVNQGDPALALSYLERMQKIRPENKPDQAHTQSILSSAYQRLGRYPEAMQAARASLRIARESGDERQEIYARRRLGQLLAHEGNVNQAIDEFERAVEIAGRLQIPDSHASILSTLAWNYLDLGERDKALASAEEAVSIARPLQARYTLVAAMNTAGHVYRALGRRQDAGQAFRQSIDMGEEFRTQLAGGEQEGRGFVSSMLTNAYRELLVMKTEEGELEEALRLAERAKARQLLDVLAEGRVHINAALSEAEKQREEDLSRQAAKANSALGGRAQANAESTATFAKAAAELDAFRAELYSAHPELKVRRAESDPVTLDQLRAFLPDRQTLLIEFVVDDDWIGAFALERGDAGAPMISLGKIALTSAVLKKQIEDFRRRLATRDLGYRAAAALLYRELLGPFARQLRNKRIVGIVPDGPLWNLPFQALVAPDGKHWIEHWATFYAPSLTALRESARVHHSMPGSPRTLLAIGPARGDIPLAAAEAQELGRLYGSGSKVLSGAEALESRWKQEAPRFRILHVATHGVLNSNNPMFSYLELKPDAADDGMLEAREILELDLHAELAVLSACETARGEIRSGEGSVGMGWAVMMAGTPSVVVSQWKVHSAATTQLMLAFHRGIRRGLARPGPLKGKAEALRQAALELLGTTTYQHPFYWAAFQMLGDGY